MTAASKARPSRVMGLVLAILSTSAESAKSTEVAWRDAVTVAIGEAHVGPWRMNDSDFRYVDDPSVDLHDDGTAVVVWADQAQKAIFLQRYSREGRPQLAAPTNVSQSGETFSWLPRVLVSAGDPETLYVLWQEIIFSGGSHGGEILFASSEDGGTTFREPVNLSNTQNGAGKGRLTAERWDNGSLDLAEGPDGDIWAAWTEYQGPLRLRHSGDGGRTFSETTQVSGSDERPVRAPSISADSEGRLHLAWTVGEDPAADIRYAVYDRRDGSFKPQIVHATNGRADAPKLAVDENDIVHLVYAVYAESADGPLERAQIQYTRARPGERFQTPQTISAAHAERFASVGFPSLAISAANVYVLWELFPDTDGRPRGLGIALSKDNGKRFAAPEIVPQSGVSGRGFNGSLQGQLMRKLAANEAGDVAVVNSSFDRGEKSLVRLIFGSCLCTSNSSSASRSR